MSNVSELRSDIFEGQSQTYTVKATYGFKEQPFNNDAKVENVKYALVFRVTNGHMDGAAYSLSGNFDGTPVQTEFSLDPMSHALTATVEVENFNQKEFTVTISCSGVAEDVTLSSIVPEGTISAEQALKCLMEKQSSLLSSLYDQNKNFNAELHLRVIVKQGKSYWYVGIATGSERLKALLIDGTNGEVLAIRDVL